MDGFQSCERCGLHHRFSDAIGAGFPKWIQGMVDASFRASSLAVKSDIDVLNNRQV